MMEDNGTIELKTSHVSEELSDMRLKEIEQAIDWIVENWNNIPDKYKTLIKPEEYQNISGLNLEEHFVILLVARQKPSIVPSYDFDEERIGITNTGKIVWGFDSGCSCPEPWLDSYPDCYEVSKSWKEFVVNLKDFDSGIIEECLQTIQDIKQDKKE